MPGASNRMRASLAIATVAMISALGAWHFLTQSQTFEGAWHSASSIRWIQPRLSMDSNASSCSFRLSATDFCDAIADAGRTQAVLREIADYKPQMTTYEEGLFHVIRGTKHSPGRGLLAESLAKGEETAALWNDLAASHLVQQSDQPWIDLDRALAATNAALEADPEYAQAHFNRALALEMLYLDQEAIVAWTLAADHSSGAWAKEARSHVENLTTQYTRGKSTPKNTTRILLRGDGLLSEASRDPVAFCSERLEYWIGLGRSVHDSFSDALILDTVHWICSDSSVAKTDALRSFWLAITAYSSGSFQPAKNGLSELAPNIPSDSPLCSIGRSMHASAAFAVADLNTTKDILDGSAGWFCQNRAYPYLEARDLAIQGSIALREAQVERAIGHFQSALKMLELGGEPESHARVMALLAEAYAKANRPSQAWEWGQMALDLSTAESPFSQTNPLLCGFLAETAQTLQAAHVQYEYAKCFAGGLTEEHSPYLHATAFIALAEADVSLGRSASDSLMNASRVIEENGLNQDIVAHWDYVAGRDLAVQSPVLARASLSRARKTYASQGNREFEILVRQEALQSSASLGNDVAELSELARPAMASVENPALRHSIERRFRMVHQARVESLLKSQRFEEALVALLQGRGVTDSQGLTHINAIARATPHRTSVLSLALIDGEIAGWLIDSSGLHTSFVSPIPEVEHIVATASGSVLLGVPDSRIDALSRLYRSIIRPIEGDLPQYDYLFVVPDDVLFSIPFAALWDNENHKYLIEKIRFGISPELVAFDRPYTPIQNGTAAIFDASSGDIGRGLPDSAQETTNLLGILESRFPTALYTDTAASKGAFLSALESSAIVHFSGHGEADLSQPELSRIVFGSEAESALFAEDLFDLTTTPVDLVTLAACDTASFSPHQPHALGLVRPMLDAGVGAVIGSLKPVSDKRYRRMMENFYRYLVEDGDVRSAYRSMQIAEIAESPSSDPMQWAAVNLYSYIR